MAVASARGGPIAVADARPGIARFMSSWVFLAPTLFFFAGWQLYPLGRVLWMSLTDYQYLRTGVPVNWVWFANFARALSDPFVLKGLWRATIFTSLFLPGMIFIPLLAAVLLDRVTNTKVATLYRLILLVPAMIPGPLIIVLWKWLYDFDIGPINYALVDVLGVFDLRNAPRWLAQPTLVFPSIAVMEWWWGIGYHTMFFLAGLATIPRDLYDAARVDGANEWQIFWRVTVPRLRPVLLVLLVLRFGTAMALLDEYLIVGSFQRTLPTYTWTVYMWDTAFQIGDWNQSYASAIGWIGALPMLAVVGLLFWVFRPRD
jgi:multiple sugar transport system permease protein